ncbi:MAG: transposase [Patiriisocius sp.]|jgi:transposase
MKKKDFRSIDSSTRQEIRKMAIKKIASGVQKKVVADFYNVNQNTINNWVKKHKEKENKGLFDSKRGVKSADKKLLNTSQEQAIQNMIIDVMPDQLKLDFASWTRRAVKDLINKKLGVNIAVNKVGDYLRSWRFSPQKPKKKAYKQNPIAVQKWLEQEYLAIKEKAKLEKAIIHWGDETGVRNSNQHGRSYAPKGRTPVKKHMSKRFSINMISTITNQGFIQFMIYKENMNADVFIKFLNQLIKSQENKVFLILDNLRVHHSKIVKLWVEDHKNDIELYYLPSYSPEKNPDEYLNCDLKYGLSEKSAPKTAEKLKENLENHMNMLQGNNARVKSYFNHKDIKYAA